MSSEGKTMDTLDRTADGFTRKCCECSRAFKGAGWQDYCAECHAEKEKNSPLRARWCCFNCNTTMEAGAMGLGGRPGWGFVCPNCKSDNTHPADGIRELEEYHGEIGTKN